MADLLIFMLIWGVWILIPIVIDGAETLVRLGVIVWSRMRLPEKPLKVREKDLPNITVVIPAYNEEKIINRCIASIKVQDYPQEKLDIVVIDDGSTDYTVKRIINYAAGRNGNGNGNGNGKNGKFHGFANGTVKINGNQYEVPDFYGGLKLLASDYHLGKPEALNTAIESTNGHGDLIITVDSDVVLSPETLKETAKAFAANPKMGAATGNVEISWQNMVQIDEDGNPVLDKQGHIVNRKLAFWENILAKCQFLEYLDSFRLGREFQSRVHSTYIMAGAYSVFRKDILKKIFYRDATLTEDFDLTVDIHRLNHHIGYIPKAKAYLEPITDWDHLYAQRVRWHRGQLEVSALHDKIIGNRSFGRMGWLGFPQMLLGDHTLAFPRLIWTPLILFFGLFGYPYQTIFMALTLMYFFYVGVTFLQIACAYFYVDKDTRQHVEDIIAYSFIMPFYRLATFYFRVSGYLLVLKEPPRWKVSGPINGIKNGINGFKNGVKNGVNGVKNGHNGNLPADRHGGNGKNGIANSVNGARNVFYILKHGLAGFTSSLKHHHSKHHAYNNGMGHRDGLRGKDKPGVGLISNYNKSMITAEQVSQEEAIIKKNQENSNILAKIIPFKKKGNGEDFDLRGAFPRKKPPVEPYKIILGPKSLESSVSEAYYYLNKNLYKDALIPYSEAVEFAAAPSDLVYLGIETAKSLFLAGQCDEAWLQLKQAEILTAEPQTKDEIRTILKRLPKEYQKPDVSILIKIAYANLKKGLIVRARDCFRKAIELSENAHDIALLRLEIAKTYHLANEKYSAHQDLKTAYLLNKNLQKPDKDIQTVEMLFSKTPKSSAEKLIYQGNKAFDSKNYTEAREYFSRALIKAGTIPQLVYLELAIAKTYFLSKRHEQTKEHLNRAKVLDPHAATYPEYQFMQKALPEKYQSPSFYDLINQGYSCLKNSSFPTARSLFKLALEKAHDIDSLILCYQALGQLFYSSGQERKARINLNNAITLLNQTGNTKLAEQTRLTIADLPKYYVKDAVKSLTKDSYSFIKKGQFSKARTAVGKGFALVNNADDLVALKAELGKVYAHAKQFKKAIVELKQAYIIASETGLDNYKYEIKSLLEYFPAKTELGYDSFIGKGYSLLASKKYKKAEKAFRESLRLAENKNQLLLSQLEIGKVKKLLNQFDEAESILSFALNLSNILSNKTKSKEISAVLESTRKQKHSKKFEKVLQKTFMYKERKNLRKAREAINQGFALADDLESMILVRVELAKIYALSNHYRNATKELNTALFVAREIKNQDLVKEIQGLLAVFPANGKNFEGLIKHGEALLSQGKLKLAKRVLDKTTRLAQTPEELLRLFLLQGKLELAAKDLEQGKRDLKKALILSQRYGKDRVMKEVSSLLAS